MMGSQLNIQCNVIAFADNTPSNNPMLRHFDFVYKLMGLPVKNPVQSPYSIPPQSSQVVYDGTRTTATDGTTEFQVTKPYLDKDTYRFTWINGTAPVFRSNRTPGITTLTQFTVSVNGPVATATATAGPFSTASIQVGDVLLIQSGSGFSVANQGKFTVIAKTSTSVSFQNLNAAAESLTVTDAAKILIFSNGGSTNQPQVGDKLSISSGFSIATQAVYELTEVTPTWVEVNVGSPNGIPLETAIPTAAGFVIYKTVKQFVMLAAQQKVTVGFNDDATGTVIVEPSELDNPERPGLLIKNGSFYKLTINNLSLSTANVTVATAE